MSEYFKGKIENSVGREERNASKREAFFFLRSLRMNRAKDTCLSEDNSREVKVQLRSLSSSAADCRAMSKVITVDVGIAMIKDFS